MLTNSYNIKAKRGDTFVSPIFQIILNDVVFDLSGVEIKITLKKSPSQEIPILILKKIARMAFMLTPAPRRAMKRTGRTPPVVQ